MIGDLVFSKENPKPFAKRAITREKKRGGQHQTCATERYMQAPMARYHQQCLKRYDQVPEEKRPAMDVECRRDVRIRTGNYRREISVGESPESRVTDGNRYKHVERTSLYCLHYRCF